MPLRTLFGVIPTAALACRGGEKTPSSGYKKEFMNYEDFEIKLLPGTSATPQFADLKLLVFIKHLKGAKKMANTEYTVTLRPVLDHRYRHLCVISLMLIHALRDGLVWGDSVEEVLDNACKASDRAVSWLSPRRPVLTMSFGNRKGQFLDLDRPTDTSTLKEAV